MQKLKLSELKIQSFVTSLEESHKRTVQGGGDDGDASSPHPQTACFDCSYGIPGRGCKQSGNYGCAGGKGGRTKSPNCDDGGNNTLYCESIASCPGNTGSYHC
ncbi:MAG: pinensin family lanthipeptide [Bacteroidota bacterium]